jgi:subtilisin family serine protease
MTVRRGFMSRFTIFILSTIVLAVFPVSALAKTLTIAVIDTGVDRNSNDKLCKMGHKSFTVDKTDTDALKDNHGHGTHVASLIRREAGLLDYCIVAIKYYADSQTGSQNLKAEMAAIQYAINIKVDYINLSEGGPEFDEKEEQLIKKALDQGIKIVAAAGNERSNIDEPENYYYPACYDKRITVVGNLKEMPRMSWVDKFKELVQVPFSGGRSVIGPPLERSPSSNYGKRVDRWEMGTEVEGVVPGGKTAKLTGTSQATGIATGKMIREQLQVSSN